jgi:hypothetical protein
MLTLAIATLHTERPALVVHDDDGVRAVALARTAQVFDFVTGAKHSIDAQG